MVPPNTAAERCRLVSPLTRGLRRGRIDWNLERPLLILQGFFKMVDNLCLISA